MRILVASLAFAAACGSSAPKESAIVQGGSDVSPTCCCKTVPQTSDKEIVPNYALTGRMECSTQNGECVDDVQCSGQTAPPSDQPAAPASTETGVPPPPTLGSDSASAPAVP